ncbi:MAG: 2-polyprenyl-3-methyl-5-hydroxy-6-metoxy-1,4-benzoquinol methylase [Pseudohongiellaceae bacterium]|jgi:2-polyprenyl-3-methyl-5-hydroxy-6-metoxy-1,4-benzoquinol methylase
MISANEDFRRKVQQYADGHGGKIYAPIPHPDFEGFPSVQGHDRFDMIKPFIPGSAKSALDIGAHWGYSSHRLTEMGLEVTAVENSKEAIYFINEIQKITGVHYKLITDSILDIDPGQYHLVIALNIFHHFLKLEVRYKKFIQFLSRLQCRTMIYQSHNIGEGQMKNAYKNFSDDDFCRFIVDNSVLTDWKYIATYSNRKIYLIWQTIDS